MRFIYLLTILLIALLAGVFFHIFYTPSLVQKYAPEFIERILPGATVTSLKVGGQTYAYPETLKLRNIRTEIEWRDKTYQFEIAQLAIENFQRFFSQRKQAVIKITGFNLHREKFEMLNAALQVTANFESKAFKNCEIVLQDGEVKFGAYHLTKSQANAQVSKEGFKISDLKGEAYGGQVKGNIEVTFSPQSSETIWIEFRGLKSQDLMVINKRIFSQLMGEFEGSLRFNRIDGEIQVFAILAEMPKGGTLSPALAERVLTYLTDEAQRDQVSMYLAKQSEIAFEDVSFQILKVNQKLAGVTFTLTNHKDAIRIRDTINVDISQIFRKIAWQN